MSESVEQTIARLQASLAASVARKSYDALLQQNVGLGKDRDAIRAELAAAQQQLADLTARCVEWERKAEYAAEQYRRRNAEAHELTARCAHVEGEAYARGLEDAKAAARTVCRGYLLAWVQVEWVNEAIDKLKPEGTASAVEGEPAPEWNFKPGDRVILGWVDSDDDPGTVVRVTDGGDLVHVMTDHDGCYSRRCEYGKLRHAPAPECSDTDSGSSQPVGRLK